MSSRLSFEADFRRWHLIAVHGKATHRLVDEMMAGLADTAERLKEIAQMVEGAYARTIASATAAVAQGVKFKGLRK